jgi:hypothetical protein
LYYLLAVLIGGTFAPLLFLFSAANLIRAPKKWEKYLPLLVLALGVMAYAWIASVETDLTRYFDMAEGYGEYSLAQAFQANILDNNLWVCIAVFWLAGKLGCVNLLPMLSVMVVYGVTFYITCDTAKTYHAEKCIPGILLLQFCLQPYVSIMGNIRNVTAFSLIVLASYRDLVQKKRNILTVVLYVLPIFIHPTALVLLLLRSVVFLSNKIKFIFLAIVAFLPQMIDFAYHNIINIIASYNSRIASIATSMILKAYWYVNDTTSELAVHVANSKADTINRALMISIAVFVTLLIYFYYDRKLSEKKDGMIDFCFELAIVVIACGWFTIGHYWRFTVALVCACGTLWIRVAQNLRTAPVWVRLAFQASPAVMALGLAIQLWNSRYITDYPAWMANIVLTNIWTILSDIVRGILAW